MNGTRRRTAPRRTAVVGFVHTIGAPSIGDTIDWYPVTVRALMAPHDGAGWHTDAATVPCGACGGTGGTVGTYPIGDASEHYWCASLPLPRRADAARGWTSLPRGIVRECERCHGTGSTVGTVDVAGTLAPRVWCGHRLVLARDVAARRDGTAARSTRRRIARESAPRAPWADVAATIASHVGTVDPFTVNGVRIVLTVPGDTGRLRARLTYADGTVRTMQVRTVAPIARAAMI